jgi:hypothetical protein
MRPKVVVLFDKDQSFPRKLRIRPTIHTKSEKSRPQCVITFVSLLFGNDHVLKYMVGNPTSSKTQLIKRDTTEREHYFFIITIGTFNSCFQIPNN